MGLWAMATSKINCRQPHKTSTASRQLAAAVRDAARGEPRVARALLVGARVEEEACRVAPVVTPAESGAALSEAPVALPLALGLLVVATTTGEVLLALLHRSPALTRDAADPAGRLLQWHAHATLVAMADGRRPATGGCAPCTSAFSR